MGREFEGRKQAVYDRSTRWRFAATPGARAALKAAQSYKYKPITDRAMQNEPREPLHDWASHSTTCLEFLAVKLSARRIVARDLAKPSKARLGQIANMGAQRGLAPIRSTLRGVA